MGAPIVDRSTLAFCPHTGSVQAAPCDLRVTIEGMSIVTATDIVTVVGCWLYGFPCVTAMLDKASRVTAGGVPVILAMQPAFSENAAQLVQGQVTFTETQSRVIAT